MLVPLVQPNAAASAGANVAASSGGAKRDFTREQIDRWTEELERGVANRGGFAPELPLRDNAAFLFLTRQTIRRSALGASQADAFLARLREPPLRDLVAETPLPADEIANGIAGFLLSRRRDAPDLAPPPSRRLTISLLASPPLVATAFLALAPPAWRDGALRAFAAAWGALRARLEPELVGVAPTLQATALAVALALWTRAMARSLERHAPARAARIAWSLLPARRPLRARLSLRGAGAAARLALGAGGLLAAVFVFAALSAAAGFFMAKPLAAGLEWPPVAWAFFGFVAALGAAIAWMESADLRSSDPFGQLAGRIEEWRQEETNPDGGIAGR